MINRSQAAGAGLCLLLLLASPASAPAMETDQYSNRDQDIADAAPVLNDKINETIRAVVADQSDGRDELAVVDAIYKRIGGWHYVDKLERWAMETPELERLATGRGDSIYSGYALWSMRPSTLIGIGKTIRLNDELVGTDKIGHFISQGRKYYRRYLKTGSETDAARRSVLTEKAVFGKLMTGSFSNADLVANFEGYRFYRSLFEDGVVLGKPAILRWDGDGWEVQREFDWADHVNAFWDEALNPNHYTLLPSIYMRRKLADRCDGFWSRPESYVVRERQALAARYRHIGLEANPELRMDVLCTREALMLETQKG